MWRFGQRGLSLYERGKLARTAPRAPFHRSRDRARYRYYEGFRGSRCNRVSAFLRKLQLLARRDEAILSGRPAAEVERREILLEGLIDMGLRPIVLLRAPAHSRTSERFAHQPRRPR